MNYQESGGVASKCLRSQKVYPICLKIDISKMPRSKIQGNSCPNWDTGQTLARGTHRDPRNNIGTREICELHYSLEWFEEANNEGLSAYLISLKGPSTAATESGLLTLSKQVRQIPRYALVTIHFCLRSGVLSLKELPPSNRGIWLSRAKISWSIFVFRCQFVLWMVLLSCCSSFWWLQGNIKWRMFRFVYKMMMVVFFRKIWVHL